MEYACILVNISVNFHTCVAPRSKYRTVLAPQRCVFPPVALGNTLWGRGRVDQLEATVVKLAQVRVGAVETEMW